MKAKVILLWQVLTLHYVFSYPAGGYVLTYVPLDDFACIKESNIDFLPVVQCESYNPNQCDNVICIDGTTYIVGSCCCPRSCKKVYWDCPTYTMPLPSSFPAAAVLPPTATTESVTCTTVTYLPSPPECTILPTTVTTGPATCSTVTYLPSTTACTPLLPTVTTGSAICTTYLPPSTTCTSLPTVSVSSPCDAVVVSSPTCNTGPVLFPTFETETLILGGALPDLAPSMEALSYTTPIPTSTVSNEYSNYEVYENVDIVAIENAVINPVIGSVSLTEPRSQTFCGYVPGSGRVSINAHFI